MGDISEKHIFTLVYKECLREPFICMVSCPRIASKSLEILMQRLNGHLAEWSEKSFSHSLDLKFLFYLSVLWSRAALLPQSWNRCRVFSLLFTKCSLCQVLAPVIQIQRISIVLVLRHHTTSSYPWRHRSRVLLTYRSKHSWAINHSWVRSAL